MEHPIRYPSVEKRIYHVSVGNILLPSRVGWAECILLQYANYEGHSSKKGSLIIRLHFCTQKFGIATLISLKWNHVDSQQLCFIIKSEISVEVLFRKFYSLLIKETSIFNQKEWIFRTLENVENLFLLHSARHSFVPFSYNDFTILIFSCLSVSVAHNLNF